MSDGFDPYYKWLAIPPGDRPPNHYQLLGLQFFENDADVISTAADRQMLHVKSFANGAHAQFTQQLLNELAKAKICLLNVKQKSIYDAELAVNAGTVATAPGLPSSSDILDPVDLPPGGSTVKLARSATNMHLTPPAVPPPVLKTRKQDSDAQGLPVAAAVAPEPVMHLESSAAAKKKAAIRRLQQIRLKRINLFGHVVAPLLGLTIGYYVLCTIGPQFDFLGLMVSDDDPPAAAANPNRPPSLAQPSTQPTDTAAAQKLADEEAARRIEERRQMLADQEQQRLDRERQLKEEEERRQRAEEARLAAEEANRQAAEERERLAAEELEKLRTSITQAAAGGNVTEFIANLTQLQTRKQELPADELGKMFIKLLPVSEEPEEIRVLVDRSLSLAEALHKSDATSEGILSREIAAVSLVAARKARLTDQTRRATLLLVPRPSP